MLATCRGLAACGYEVAAAGFHSLAPTRWSRCCSDYVRVRDPRSDALGFVADLAAYLARQPCDLVIPGSDVSLLAISLHRGHLEGLANLGLPTHSVIERSLDRESLARSAEEAGLGTPSSIRCEDLDDAISVAAEISFPLLLKSRRVAWHDDARIVTGRRTVRIETSRELRMKVDAVGEPFLVQRAVPGQTVSFGGVMADDDLLGGCLAQYERTWPPRAGNAAYAITIDIPAETERAIISLVANIGWRGIFEIELIRSADGSLLPIDFNPRPYGSMALAITAGSNLPALWCDCLSGGAPPETRAVPGRRYRWEEGDLMNMLWQVRHGNLATARRIMRPSPAVVHPHFQRADPMPLLARFISLVARCFTRSGRSRYRATLAEPDP
jgi:predicted ATP-grasp superfamily ATP-dependent carboligase